MLSIVFFLDIRFATADMGWFFFCGVEGVLTAHDLIEFWLPFSFLSYQTNNVIWFAKEAICLLSIWAGDSRPTPSEACE